MTDTAWIDAALTSARPQAVGALLRYFRNLDTAEEAFQNASLRALKSWPQNGPPRDPAAWLIMVGRNAAIDEVRRSGKQEALPDDILVLAFHHKYHVGPVDHFLTDPDARLVTCSGRTSLVCRMIFK